MINSLTPTIRRPRIVVEENSKRIKFFSNGAYKYTPSDEYLRKYTKYKLKLVK